MVDKRVSVSVKELRNFSLIIAVALIALWFFKGRVWERSETLPGVAFMLLVVGIFVPRALAYPYRVWMWFGEKMGFLMSRVVLGLFFFILLTPIALLRRVFTKDPLELTIDRTAASYYRTKTIQSGSKFSKMF